jgi:hypothetical protein
VKKNPASRIYRKPPFISTWMLIMSFCYGFFLSTLGTLLAPPLAELPRLFLSPWVDVVLPGKPRYVGPVQGGGPVHVNYSHGGANIPDISWAAPMARFHYSKRLPDGAYQDYTVPFILFSFLLYSLLILLYMAYREYRERRQRK